MITNIRVTPPNNSLDLPPAVSVTALAAATAAPDIGWRKFAPTLGRIGGMAVPLTPWNGVAIFLGGLAIGALLGVNIFDTNNGVAEDATSVLELSDTIKDIGESDSENTISQESAITSSRNENADSESSAITTILPEDRPNTPSVYVEMLGPSYQNVSLEDLHLTFGSEHRDEGWAFAVESEISQYIANNGVADWAEIEYIECRKSICEIAGYLRGDTTHDAREIVDGISSSTWWHSEKSVHLMESNPDGLERFLVFVTGLDFENRMRQPRLVE